MRIFVSHSTSDRALASALKTLLLDLFGHSRLDISFSSDQTAGGGIPPGAQWLPWIREHIEKADQTYVLLTRNSLAKPWVLWEAGAAAGVALALNKEAPVVPITFGITDTEIPSPLSSGQRVKGDSADGVERLLQAVNLDLGEPLTPAIFGAAIKPLVRSFAAKVDAALPRSETRESLLSSIPPGFSASRLAGFWVTCYQVATGENARCHADIALVTPESDRRVRIRNYPPEPRTDGHAEGFRNEIEAELVTRHLIGYWKNLRDTRYFGALQLAVRPEDNVMDGRYTSLGSDIKVDVGRWRWVRLERSVTEEQLSRVSLREPGLIYSLVKAHGYRAGPLRLTDVAQEA